ncbi:MAG: endonuclease [Paludibacter sp.]|nr:endonuclease [Paludibacter sp.]
MSLYGSGVNHTWNGFYITDKNESTNLVIDMYSDSLRYFAGDYLVLNYPGFGSKIHIEHSVPKSWWGSHEWAAYKDLNHLYPADGSTNMSKSDNPLGIVTGTPTKNNGVSKIGPASYPDYSGNVFEPADEYKGDFARTYFYMATAYEHYKNLWDTTKPENLMESNTYPVFKPRAITMLLQWHRQDPVSPKETTRNEKVYSIQGNRNPFIDYPQLAEYIWGDKTGTPFSFTSSTISVTGKTLSNNSSLQFTKDQYRKLNVKGTNLKGAVTINITGNGASMFSISTNSISAEKAGGPGTEVQINYSPTSTGSHNAVLNINSLNASPMLYKLNGNN